MCLFLKAGDSENRVRRLSQQPIKDQLTSSLLSACHIGTPKGWIYISSSSLGRKFTQSMPSMSLPHVESHYIFPRAAN